MNADLRMTNTCLTLEDGCLTSVSIWSDALPVLIPAEVVVILALSDDLLPSNLVTAVGTVVRGSLELMLEYLQTDKSTA